LLNNNLVKLTSFTNLFVLTCISAIDFPSLITMNCSLSALIENKIFSVHGGLSPAISTLDQVRNSTLIYVSEVLDRKKATLCVIYYSYPDTNY